MVSSIINGRCVVGNEPFEVNSSFSVSQISDENRIPKKIFYSKPLSKSFFENMYVIFKSNKDKYVKGLSNECSIPLEQSSKKIDAILDFLKNAYETYEDYVKKSTYIFSPKGTVVIGVSSTDPLEGMINALIPALFTGNNCYVKPSRRNFLLNYLFYSDMSKIPEFTERCHLLFVTNECFKESILNNKFDFIYWSGSYESAMNIQKITINSSTEFYFEGSGYDFLYVDDIFDKDLFKKIIYNSLTNLNGDNCNRVKVILSKNDNYLPIKNLVHDVYKKIEEDIVDTGILPSYKEVSLEKIFQDSSKSILQSLVEKEDTILSLLNESDFGLGLTILTNNEEKFLMNKYPVSRLNINCDPLDVSYFEPWGGIKKSGSRGSIGWIDKFSNKCFVKRGNKDD